MALMIYADFCATCVTFVYNAQIIVGQVAPSVAQSRTGLSGFDLLLAATFFSIGSTLQHTCKISLSNLSHNSVSLNIPELIKTLYSQKRKSVFF